MRPAHLLAAAGVLFALAPAVPASANVFVATTANTSRTLSSFRRPALGRGIGRPWRCARTAIRTGIASIAVSAIASTKKPS